MNFEVYVLASGSSANCTVIRSSGTMVMLDCGLSGKQAAQRMADVGLDPGKLDAVVITHEHSDHIKGVGVMSRRYHLPVHGSVLTHLASESTVMDLHSRVYFHEGDSFEIGDISITPFPLSHDASDPMGYVFRSNGHSVAACTDTGVYDGRIISELQDSDVLILESNHDPNMLQKGPYPRSLKNRIAGELGHLSNNDAGNLLLEVLSGDTRAVMLAHLSQENNLPDIALGTVTDILEGEGVELPELHIAKRYKASTPVLL